MQASRLLALGLTVGLLAFAGCTSRRDKLVIDELKTENTRLSTELNRLRNDANQLEEERDIVAEENVRLREQAEALSLSLNDLNRSGSLPSDVFTFDEGGISLNEDVAFKSGSADLTSAGRDGIAQLARELKKGDYDGTKIVVEGHTDDRPVSRPATREKFGTNWGLSAMRSAAVIEALQGEGIEPTRLVGMFRGQYNPRKGVPVSNRAAHRRVEIFLSL